MAVCGNETIEMNHMFSLPTDSRLGNNDCHMQADKYEAARMVGIDMSIQMIVNNSFEVPHSLKTPSLLFALTGAMW
jgi:nickel-dependent lactate racemase